MPIYPVFSNWVNFSKKWSVINLFFYKFKELSIHLFFSKFKSFLKKQVSFFFNFLAFITLFQLSVGYVFFARALLNVGNCRRQRIDYYKTLKLIKLI